MARRVDRGAGSQSRRLGPHALGCDHQKGPWGLGSCPCLSILMIRFIVYFLRAALFIIRSFLVAEAQAAPLMVDGAQRCAVASLRAGQRGEACKHGVQPRSGRFPKLLATQVSTILAWCAAQAYLPSGDLVAVMHPTTPAVPALPAHKNFRAMLSHAPTCQGFNSRVRLDLGYSSQFFHTAR